MKLALSLIALCLLLTASVLSATLPDFSFHWNRFIEVRQANGYLLGLSEYGITVLDYNEADDNYSQGEALLLDGRPTRIKIYGDSLLIQTLDSQIQIIDFHNAPQLELIGSIKPQATFYDFALHNESIYLACGYESIRRVSTASSNGEIIDYSNKGVLVTQVDILDNQLLALDEYNGLMTYDLDGTGFGTFDEYLYLEHRAYNFGQLNDSAVVIMNQTANALVAERENRSFTIGGTLAISSQPLRTFVTDDAILLVSARTIEKYDRSDFSLIEIATLSNLRAEGALVSDGGREALILPNDNGGLSRFVLDDLSISKQVLNKPARIQSVEATRMELVVAPDDDTLQFYEVNQSEQPKRGIWYYRPISSILATDINGDSVLAIYADGNLEIAVRQVDPPMSYLSHRDIEDVASIRELKYVGPIGGGGEYVVSRKINHVTLYNLRDSEPSIIGTDFHFSDNVSDVAFRDSLLAVAYGHTVELYTLDSTLMLSPLTIRVFDAPANRVVLYNQKMITIDANQLMLWDVSQPARPYRLDVTELDQIIVDIEQVGDVLLAVGPGGAYAIDLSGDRFSVDKVGMLPSTMLAWVDGVLFTSDGTGIHGYRLDLNSGLPGNVIPETYALYQNYPNPFNNSTVIQFDLPQASHVTVMIYNSLGRRVKTLIDRSMDAGQHAIRWNGVNSSGEPVASGIYFYRLKTDEREATRKMVLLK